MKKRLLILIPLILVVCLMTYGLAHLFTGNSLYARTIAWMESDVGDHRRFPSCALENDGPVFQFQPDPERDYRAVWQRVADEHGSKSFDQLLEENDTTALIVIQDDRLLYENYLNGYTRESTQTSFSSAKSFVSALVGIAIEQGAIASVEEPITTYIPELLERDPRFGEITLRHLLTMSSGIHYEEYGLPWSDDAVTYYAPDLQSATLERVWVETPPGETFHYNNYNLILEGIILERATGQTVCDYFEAQIWQPLGMEASGSWSVDSERTRFAKMESGINGLAIDFAKFGRLYLRGGDWDGQQVLGWPNRRGRMSPPTRCGGTSITGGSTRPRSRPTTSSWKTGNRPNAKLRRHLRM